ncbi:MAG: HlyD family efflux transporter periplasmic adaptor subunit [Thermoanaerobaculia bacterium]|nr:MAG: HlyD family efflux transporter periplasmic adaptor subunit [Thermoanaerobaculia bacterium]MBZ0101458.1 HlyD family efflux transporter periplasmic adaptor subunit [Thermoanaerobaculia bacterium]
MNPRRIVPVVVAAAVAGGLIWQLTRSRGDDGAGLAAAGTVEATDARLGFELPGRLVEIAVREGERVAAGQELAWLDGSELEARRGQAAAQVDVARARLAELESGFRREEIEQGRAAAAAAGERVADAERDLERTRMLFDGKAVAREALDKSALALELARRQREQAASQLNLLERGARPEQIAGALAQVAQAEAAVETLDATLAKLRLVAPFAGVISVRHREPGETVGVGTPVLTLLDLDDRWVRIYVPENRLGRVALGQRAAITADTFPERKYEGSVSFIGSEAEFTPKNVQTNEERVRLVYAVRIRITGDPDHELKPGLPADVRLEEAP